MVFLFLSFSVFVQAIEQKTNNSLNEAANKEELELAGLKAFLDQYPNKILLKDWGEEELSHDEASLAPTTQSMGNDSKTIKISIKDLSVDQENKLVNYRITKAAKLYYELLRLQVVKKAIDLIPEDIIIFQYLLIPSAYWNGTKTLEGSIKLFKKLANIYNNVSSQMGGLEFENFFGFNNNNQTHYVWFETKEYLKGDVLRELEESYGNYQIELSKNEDKSSIQLPAPFISPQDAEKLFRERQLNKSSSGLILLDGRTYQRELFVGGKFLRKPAHWNDCQTNLFISDEIHMDHFPLKEQFNGIEYPKVIRLQHLHHLKKQNDYQEKHKNSKTIVVFFPTGTIAPRTIIYDTTSFSWLGLCTGNPEHPQRPLGFIVLTDTLDGARAHCASTYIATQESTREQVLAVELSYDHAHEITLDTFIKMQKAYYEQSSEKFWESSNLAGVDLRDIDLLIIVQDNGKLYLPRSMAEQILPSYLVEVPVNKIEITPTLVSCEDLMSQARKRRRVSSKNLSLSNDNEKEDKEYSGLSVKTLVNKLEALLLEKKS